MPNNRILWTIVIASYFGAIFSYAFIYANSVQGKGLSIDETYLLGFNTLVSLFTFTGITYKITNNRNKGNKSNRNDVANYLESNRTSISVPGRYTLK